MSCREILYFCAMFLRKIALLNFKNIAQEELDTALKETAECETKAKLDAVRAEDDEPEK